MKKLILVSVFLLAFVATSAAQQPMKPVIYAGGGLSMPIGPTVFKDYWKMGVGFGGGIGIQAKPGTELIAKFFYNSFGFDWDKFFTDNSITGVTGEGTDFQAIEFGVDAKYLFGQAPTFKPFLVAGVGMVNVKFTDAKMTGTTTATVPLSGFSETKLSVSGGIGSEYMISPTMALWLEGRIVMVLTSGDSINYMPFRVGLKFML